MTYNYPWAVIENCTIPGLIQHIIIIHVNSYILLIDITNHKMRISKILNMIIAISFYVLAMRAHLYYFLRIDGIQ